MNAVEFKSYCFTYPGQAASVLEGLSFVVPTGAFAVLCGLSGSGKSTLLRCIKPELAPVGGHHGCIKAFGRELSQLASRESAASIGFVMQDPENQLVCDTVWHELAFGLENLGMPQEIMRRRVAETAHFFGIGAWFEKRTSELSGGQKQLLNLAAVMVMQPRLLVLDEPTAQLDPIAAKEFLQALHRVNMELGTTVIICEHRLEEVFPMASQLLFLERGRLAFDGTPQEFSLRLCEKDAPFVAALPAATNIAHLLGSFCCSGGDGKGGLLGKGGFGETVERGNLSALPITVHDGRAWLHGWLATRATCSSMVSADVAMPVSPAGNRPVLQAKDIWFRYGKHDDFVLQHASIDICPGRVHAIVGGNGSGKSTLLFALAGVRKTARGRVVRRQGLQVALMAQNPKTLFVCDTVEDDLLEWRGRFGYGDDAVREIIERFDLTQVAQHHPYDLSGGELQKAALAKLLLTNPDVLLLDEPVKGLDAVAKSQIAALLRELADAGKAVVLVSHELDFVAQLADVCSMMFGGAVTCEDGGRDFFSQNLYFTTGVNRITRGMLDDCVTLADVKRTIDADAGGPDGEGRR